MWLSQKISAATTGKKETGATQPTYKIASTISNNNNQKVQATLNSTVSPNLALPLVISEGNAVISSRMMMTNTLPETSVQSTTTTSHQNGQEKTKPPPRMLILTSSMSMSREIAQQQERAITLLRAKGIEFETLDGALAVNKTKRNELFALSGLRARYPQFFLVQEDNGEKRLSFFADWETLEAINDASKMPEHILDANPSILTWDRALGVLTAPVDLCQVPQRGTGLETHKLPKSNCHSINNSTW